MKLLQFLFLALFISVNSFAQIDNLISKFDLPEILEESSGLIHFNNKLISHNDGGNDANLFELDTITGQITRTIQIANADNNDWEDIDQDDDFIYIGDFGNNDGDRTDLKIYRIDKSDYLNNTSISAEIINFSYEDQTDFDENPQTNFDAEAMVILNDEILIFTKNRGDFKTNAYVFPKSIGTHSAIKIGTYNAQGLITGATVNYFDYSIFLTGYAFSGSALQPFLVYLGDFTGNSVFDGTIEKTSISQNIGAGSQLEAITIVGNNRYFLSREERNGLTQRVFAFSSTYVLDIDDFSKTEIVICPNPFVKNIKIVSDSTIRRIEIFDLNGKKLFTKIKDFSNLNISFLPSGNFILKVFTSNQQPIIKKLIKE